MWILWCPRNKTHLASRALFALHWLSIQLAMTLSKMVTLSWATLSIKCDFWWLGNAANLSKFLHSPSTPQAPNSPALKDFYSSVPWLMEISGPLASLLYNSALQPSPVSASLLILPFWGETARSCLIWRRVMKGPGEENSRMCRNFLLAIWQFRYPEWSFPINLKMLDKNIKNTF